MQMTLMLFSMMRKMKELTRKMWQVNLLMKARTNNSSKKIKSMKCLTNKLSQSKKKFKKSFQKKALIPMTIFPMRKKVLIQATISCLGIMRNAAEEETGEK